MTPEALAAKKYADAALDELPKGLRWALITVLVLIAFALGLALGVTHK